MKKYFVVEINKEKVHFTDSIMAYKVYIDTQKTNIYVNSQSMTLSDEFIFMRE